MPDNFSLVETAVPDLNDGEVLVANHYMSVDPYMRGRMSDVKSYVPPFPLDAPLEGAATGEVLASSSADVPVGATVLHNRGWREHAVVPGSSVKTIDPTLAPESAFLGALGMTGLTAYAGLMYAARFAEGDAVFVSGAAGAVGSLVGQIAKMSGASRVVGSAGSSEKVARLEELGFDAAFNYRDGPVVDSLRRAAPDGIDVYFDNVGGEHLEAAISVLNAHGRVAVCGAISQYNATEPTPAPRNLFRQAADPAGIPRRDVCRQGGGVRAEDGELARRRLGHVGRDGPRRAGERAGRVHRPAAGRQHGQDAGPAVTQR